MADNISAKSRAASDANASEKTLESSGTPKSPGRRRFIAGLGAATAAVSTGVLAPLVAASSASAHGPVDPGHGPSADPGPPGVTHNRVVQALTLRISEATEDARVGAAVN